MAELRNLEVSPYRECDLLSLKDILLVKVAVQVCVQRDTKREILFSELEYVFISTNEFDRKEQWNTTVLRKAQTVLKTLQLAQTLQREILGLVPAIGLNMLIWAKYHEAVVGFSRKDSRNFLRNSFFTPKGNIDNKKAAAILMTNENLNYQKKYKLVCLYCLEDYIQSYIQFNEMSLERFSYVCKQTELVTFWCRHPLFDEIPRVHRKYNVEHEGLVKAVRSGSKAGVKYFLENTKINSAKYTLVYFAELAVRIMTESILYDGDWIVFRTYGEDQSWIPKDYYTDILCLLLAKMTQGQLTKFLIKDIESVSCYPDPARRYSMVLDCFLSWPYQNFFMKTVELMWEFLPMNNYAVLLLKICDNIESQKEKNLRYGEQNSYDFRRLLKNFWTESPERYKRYVFSNQKVIYKTHEIVQTKTFIGLLVKLLMLNNFTLEDRENALSILADATNSEKQKIFNSKQWIGICILLMKEEKWEVLDRFCLIFLTKDMARAFKKKFSFLGKIRRTCVDFTMEKKWSAADSFIMWCSFSQEEIIELKRKMINSYYGKVAVMETCLNLIGCDDGIKEIDKISRWYFYSEDELNNFKKTLISSSVHKCTDLLRGLLYVKHVNNFINWSLSDKDEIQRFKKSIAYKVVGSICQEIISHFSEDDIREGEIRESGFFTNFRGEKWEEVENFLTWCFSSEVEIDDFKKNWLLKEFGHKIHFHLIKSNKWSEAGAFFTWLGLTAKEATEFKRETLFKYAPAYKFLNRLLCESEPEAVALFLRWHLADRETVVEFSYEFEILYFIMFEREWLDVELGRHKPVLQIFDLAIEELLHDLEEEKEESKGRRETRLFHLKKLILKWFSCLNFKRRPADCSS